MFKYCRKCIGMRQFKVRHDIMDVRKCDVCGEEG